MYFGGGGSLMVVRWNTLLAPARHTILLLKVKGEGQERKKYFLCSCLLTWVQHVNRLICIFYSCVSVQFSQHLSLLPFSPDERQV